MRAIAPIFAPRTKDRLTVRTTSDSSVFKPISIERTPVLIEPLPYADSLALLPRIKSDLQGEMQKQADAWTPFLWAARSDLSLLNAEDSKDQ